VSELDELRERVRELDSEIISLIGKRIEITKKIGGKKAEQGIPLQNREIEKSVIQNAVRVAHGLGVSEALVKSIMQQLVTESRIQQERIHFSAFSGDKENILIVGGLGEMGEWFSRFFQNQGHEVSIYDIKGKSETFKSYESLEQGIEAASCILIAILLSAVPEIIDRITELKFKGIVFDIASLKGYLKDSIKRAGDKGISITSIHLMFSPNTRTLSDKVICFCDCGNEKANQKIGFLFKDTAASIVKLSLEENDRVVSYVLGLSHIINIIFMKILMSGEYNYDALKKVANTTFLSRMVTAGSVIKENPYLYYDIQRFDPFKNELYEKLNEAVKYMTDIVLSDNMKMFLDIMKKGKEWLVE
jgi:chorismate mutase/prephenate dehydrogenase